MRDDFTALDACALSRAPRQRQVPAREVMRARLAVLNAAAYEATRGDWRGRQPGCA